MNYLDWGPFMVNPKPEGPGHICYQCGKPGARVQAILQEDYELVTAIPHNTWRVREDAPKRHKCNLIRDCDRAAL